MTYTEQWEGLEECHVTRQRLYKVLWYWYVHIIGLRGGRG